MNRLLILICIAGLAGAQTTTVNGPNKWQDDGIKLTAQEPVNISTQPLMIELPNASAGTALGSLVKKVDTTGTLQVTKTATTDTNNALGCVQSGNGPSGTAQIAVLGTASCLFDAIGVVDGDFIVVSTATPGTVSDAGTTQPTGVLNLGVAKGSHTAGSCASAPCGPYTVLLMTPDALGAAGTGIVASPATSQKVQPTTDATGLIVQQRNGTNTVDTFSIQDKSNNKLLQVNSANQIITKADVLFNGQRPGVDVVALGADSTGAVDSSSIWQAAHDSFNGDPGGTIYGCGTFKLNSTLIITNPITIASNCGPAGNVFGTTSQRGGLVFTGGTSSDTIPAPTVALTLTCATTGGSLAAATYHFKYTWINGFGETTASPDASCAVASGTTGSVKVANPIYTDGGFAYEVYASTDGVTYHLQPQGNFVSSGTLTGPPFLITSASSSGYLVPTLSTYTTGGVSPPGSNTATHGMTLVQVGTPATVAVGTVFKDVYFHDTGVLSSGLVVVNANHSVCEDCGFDGFTANGTALGGGTPYEQGGIAMACLNAGNTNTSTSNFTELRHPEIYNNTLGVLAACSDFGIDDNGDITANSGQVGIDYAGGNIHIMGMHFNIDTGMLAGMVARGNNNGNHYGGDVRAKMEGLGVASGPGIKLTYQNNMNIDIVSCVGPNTNAAEACITLDNQSNGNIVRVNNQLTQVPFSDGTTTGKDATGTNNITVVGNSTWQFMQPLRIRTGQSSNTDLGGKVTLSAGSGSYSFTGTYTTAPYCVATDTTAANAVKASTTTTTLSLTGTSTDVVAYHCFGAN